MKTKFFTILLIFVLFSCNKNEVIKNALIIGDPLSCGINNMLLFPVGTSYSPVVYEKQKSVDISVNRKNKLFFTENRSVLNDRFAQVEYLNKNLNDFDIRNILFYSLISGESYSLSSDTLHILSFAIHKEFDSGNFFAGFWMGDGALAIYTESKELILLGMPDSGEFSGETAFITMNKLMTPEELAKRIYYEVTDDFTALFAMTDGISDPKFATDQNLKNISYWDNLWDELQKEVFPLKDDLDTNLLGWLDFWAHRFI